MNQVQNIYRSDSCKALAEKVAHSDVYASLNITIHIEQILKKRDPYIVAQIQQAIAKKEPFYLFSDKKHYCIVIPCNLVVACYVDGVQITLETCKDNQQFQNRVKILFVAYDKFQSVNLRDNRSLTGRTDGARQISENGS